ncbi:MAG: outer membrane beta-barrel protein [Crocinitomicaceae bacterium]
MCSTDHKFAVLGQHSLGLKINGGLSRISNNIAPANSIEIPRFTLSGQAGFFYSLQFRSKSVLGVELLFNQIEGKEKFEFDFTDENGNNAGYATGATYRHISYLSLPIYYGFKLNNLLVNIGFQTSLLLASNSQLKGLATTNNEVIKMDNKFELPVDNYDFGPRLGVSFQLNDMFAIESTYYYGMKNIIENSNPLLVWRVQQVTLGLRYMFQTNTKK